MYLRNVKQIIRAGASGFDERRYGFNGLMDLLRACQREGILRLERDRRGGLRVFPGQALQRVAPARASQPVPALADMPSDDQPIDIDASSPAVAAHFDVEEPDEVEIIEVPVAAVDTTAELLGRAKPKRPRGGRAPASSGIAGTSAPAPRKTARAAGSGTRKRRTGRSKKAAGEPSGQSG